MIIVVEGKEFKKCPKCEIIKFLTDFQKHKNRKDGVQVYCKECSNTIDRRDYRNNIDYETARGKKYRESHKESVRIQIEEWRKANLPRVRLRENTRYATDLMHHIEKRIRANIRGSLRYNYTGKAKKASKSINLLGCTPEFYKTYLESLFTEDMTWEKYMKGEIEVDHHPRPVCSFDLTIPEEQFKCFHYTNTRPLWFTPNRKKSAEDKKLSIRTKLKFDIISHDLENSQVLPTQIQTTQINTNNNLPN